MADYNRCEEYIVGQDHEDHERAFFDSADWALCKRTPHQQLPPRRPACTSGRDSTTSIFLFNLPCRMARVYPSEHIKAWSITFLETRDIEIPEMRAIGACMMEGGETKRRSADKVTHALRDIVREKWTTSAK
ncbi:hypothetical protein LguiA_001015 [Lonicera macranthoides]